MSKKIHIGDAGSDIVVHFVIANGTSFDISTSSAHNIYLKSPSGAVSTKAAVFTTDGTDGRIKYVLQASDITELGIWRIWGDANLSPGKRTSDSDYFIAIG